MSTTQLVLQNASLVLLMRYSRTQSGPMYASSTAVLSGEFIKLFACLVIVTLEQGGFKGLCDSLRAGVFNSSEMIKICIPAGIYTLQNNVLYFALSRLDAATFMVCYQV